MDSHLGWPILKNIMKIHIIFRKSTNPATLSKDIIKIILREELNYKGLITSDCMKWKLFPRL